MAIKSDVAGQKPLFDDRGHAEFAFVNILVCFTENYFAGTVLLEGKAKSALLNLVFGTKRVKEWCCVESADNLAGKTDNTVVRDCVAGRRA